jgi:hypothetical protein
MTRYPAREKLAAWLSQMALVPVFAWSSTIGTPVPPVSVNHNLTPGSSAYSPERVLSAAGAETLGTEDDASIRIPKTRIRLILAKTGLP